ncbi:hypothetical protein H8A95_14325 [Bradyrhizobium sp. Pear76]|uniref:hypothetical protein n=1 Tax=Bradyrhizobium oropedii TaxID=1571201 RepID=UPI0030846B28|nr:hypothetical protein [Bradyrhizobium oropedii]
MLRFARNDGKASSGAAEFARTRTGVAGCATSASPSSLCWARGIEKQTLKPSDVVSVTMPWAGSVDCSITHESSG